MKAPTTSGWRASKARATRPDAIFRTGIATMSRFPAPPRDPVLPTAADRGEGDRISDAERAVLDAVRDLAYGQVEVVVHSSRIVQITRSQKLRLGD